MFVIKISNEKIYSFDDSTNQLLFKLKLFWNFYNKFDKNPILNHITF